MLLAVYARTGLFTFHGPIGLDPWNSFTVNYFRRLIMEGECPFTADHIKFLGIPTWYGSMIGHIPLKLRVPGGIKARIDATIGTIELLEPAVKTEN